MTPEDDLSDARAHAHEEQHRLVQDLGLELRRGWPPPVEKADTDEDRARRRELLARNWESDP